MLTPEERAKGFVRPVWRSYVHAGMEATFNGAVLIKPGLGGGGSRTMMGLAIAETYAGDPTSYTGTFCVCCGEHRPLAQFVWEGTQEQVGS